MTEVFPHRAVRDISTRGGTVSACAADYVNFSLDFEPLGSAGYEFVTKVDGLDEHEREVHEECAPSILYGVLLNFTGAGMNDDLIPVGRLDNAEDGPLIAVRVVLTRARYHLVDSAPYAHRHAGWRAARKAREELAGESSGAGTG
ncbi:translation factor GTPase family protein [Allokutzneria albata]|uniref:hypothetical protein n=1 Tax=Allokutzneria albata TaxID=211114 RepID=UPI0004C3C0EA|nr:hypothetical protein [Allokutzneria albata]